MSETRPVLARRWLRMLACLPIILVLAVSVVTPVLIESTDFAILLSMALGALGACASVAIWHSADELR